MEFDAIIINKYKEVAKELEKTPGVFKNYCTYIPDKAAFQKLNLKVSRYKLYVTRSWDNNNNKSDFSDKPELIIFVITNTKVT